MHCSSRHMPCYLVGAIAGVATGLLLIAIVTLTFVLRFPLSDRTILLMGPLANDAWLIDWENNGAQPDHTHRGRSLSAAWFLVCWLLILVILISCLAILLYRRYRHGRR